MLFTGIAGFGVAISLMIRAGLGLGPWDALHVGLHRVTGVSVGTATVGAGVALVLVNLLLGVRPGPGTLTNMVMIGVAVDLVLPFVPVAPGWPAGLAFFAAGIALSGLSTGMYIAAGLGKGPRDGLMLAVAGRTGWSVLRVRTGLELTVLLAGWLLGGTVGVGTVLFTLAIGPSAQWGLRLFGVLPAAPAVETVEKVREERRRAA